MLNQITQLRMPNGEEIAIVDWTQKPLYASCDIGSGANPQSIDLFQVSVGRPVPTAPRTGGGAVTARSNTLADTNVSTQGGAASTEEFLVYSIRPDVQFYVHDGNDFTTRTATGSTPGAVPAQIFMPMPTLEGLAELNAKLLIELEISGKIYSQAGFGWFNSGFGPAAGGVSTTAAGTNKTPATQGSPGEYAVQTLLIPQHIGGQEKFKLRLTNPTATAIQFGKTEATPSADVITTMATIRIYLTGLYKRPVS